MQVLQQETRAVSLLELELNTQLEFGGIQTEAAETAIRRAKKGGLLTGEHALGIASLSEGVSNLQRLLRSARHAAKGTLMEAEIEALVAGCVAP
jgi:dsDNA-specific endonuclease/ATPase MutS2